MISPGKILMKIKLLAATAAIAIASLCATAASAAVTITIQQSGTNVVTNLSGSLNLTGASSLGTASLVSGINSGLAVYTAVQGNGEDFQVGLTGPADFGSPISALSTTSNFAGDVFRIFGDFGRVTVPLNYTSGSALSATSTYFNTTLASLGLQVGSYVYISPSDTITVNVGPMAAAIPEPGTWAMMLVGFGGMGAAMRKSRKAKAILQVN